MKSILGWSLIAALVIAESTAAQEISGIGAALGIQDDQIVVAKILPDMPPAAAGTLHEGDIILSVGNQSEPPVDVRAEEFEKAIQMIRGPKGTTVRLTIIPEGKTKADARVVSIVRGEIKAALYLGSEGLLEPKTAAPEVTWLTFNGKQRQKLSDLVGKVVVLEFWATWCVPCQEEMAAMQKLIETHPEWKDRVAIVTLSVDDDAETALKHVSDRAWTNTQNGWVTGDVVKAFQVGAVPTTYLIDALGQIDSAGSSELLAARIDRLLIESNGEKP